MSAEADAAASPLGERAERHDPPVAAPGHLVVGLVAGVHADGDRPLVAVDGDEREIGSRAEAVDLVLPRPSASSASIPSGRRRRRCARRAAPSSRSSGQAMIDTPSIGDRRRHVGRADGAAPRTSAPARKPSRVNSRRSARRAARRRRRRCAWAGRVGWIAAARMPWSVAHAISSRPIPSPRWAGATVPSTKQRSWTIVRRDVHGVGDADDGTAVDGHDECRSPATCARSTAPRRARSRRGPAGSRRRGCCR